MKNSLLLICLFSLLAATHAVGQKPFTEGTIVYKVRLEAPGKKAFNGTYTFTFKGVHIKKELMLDNGYADIELYDVGANTVYSLQTVNGKKYAIQLSMGDISKAQEQFAGYSINNEQSSTQIAGCNAYKGRLNYRSGAASEVYYTKDWRPSQPITFERFPDAKFMPLNYNYTDANGMSMRFEADKVSAGPVESSLFRIPADYKVISNEEYRQMSR